MLPFRHLLRRRLQRDVDRMAAAVGIEPTYEPGDTHDAFAHAYASARLALRLGGTLARLLGELNERFGSDAFGKRREAAMDRANNAVGRAIGLAMRAEGRSSKDETARRVRRALDEGRLTRLEEA